MISHQNFQALFVQHDITLWTCIQNVGVSVKNSEQQWKVSRTKYLFLFNGFLLISCSFNWKKIIMSRLSYRNRLANKHKMFNSCNLQVTTSVVGIAIRNWFLRIVSIVSLIKTTVICNHNWSHWIRPLIKINQFSLIKGNHKRNYDQQNFLIPVVGRFKSTTMHQCITITYDMT